MKLGVNSNMKLTNRTFIISGSSSGLGLASARDLYNAGAYISLFDLNENKELTSELNTHAQFHKVDVTNTRDIESAIKRTIAWCRETEAPLRGVISCAGVATASKIINAHGDPHSMDLWNFTLSINLTGTFDLTRLVCQHLINNEPEGFDGERGIVIMVSSSAAFEAQPGQVAYAATKGALHSMTLPLARDLARYGIRVNTIAPGIFASNMSEKMPAKTRASLQKDLVFPPRFGDPSEFAETVRWLIQSTYMNGETVRLSGAARLPAKL